MTKSVTPTIDEDVVDFTPFTRQPHQLIPILQYCQDQSGYISRAAVNQISEYLGVSEAHIYGVASFYTQFRFEKPGEISPDGKVEFHEVACLGCCAQAPVVEMDGRVHGKVTRKKLSKVLEGR